MGHGDGAAGTAWSFPSSNNRGQLKWGLIPADGEVAQGESLRLRPLHREIEENSALGNGLAASRGKLTALQISLQTERLISFSDTFHSLDQILGDKE